MKIIKNILKRVIISIGVIYSLNIILGGYNIFIPLNIVNIVIGTILGPLGIAALVIVLLVIM